MAIQAGNSSTAVQNTGSDTDDATGDGSYVILISVDGNGQILVGVEGDADGDQSGGGGAAAPGSAANAGAQSAGSGAQQATGGGDAAAATPVAMTPARNIKDALTQALEIYKNNGQVSQSNGDADFNAGFDGDSGGNAGATNRGAAGAAQ